MGTATPNFETGPRPGNSVAPSHAAKNPVVVVGLSLKAQICGLRVTSEVHILSHCCSFILKTTTCSLTLSRGGAKKCSNQVTSSKWSLTYFWKSWPTPASFVYFRSFQTQSYRKTVFFSVIQTRIDGVEGEHVVHLTTTTALTLTYFVRGSITLPTVSLLFDSFGFDQTSKSVFNRSAIQW